MSRCRRLARWPASARAAAAVSPAKRRGRARRTRGVQPRQRSAPNAGRRALNSQPQRAVRPRATGRRAPHPRSVAWQRAGHARRWRLRERPRTRFATRTPLATRSSAARRTATPQPSPEATQRLRQTTRSRAARRGAPQRSRHCARAGRTRAERRQSH